MNTKVERLAQMRELLLRMEGELGLEGLTRFERDLLYAIRCLVAEGKTVRSAALRAHELVEAMTQPTYHRALRELILRGYIAPEEHNRSTYRVLAFRTP